MLYQYKEKFENDGVVAVEDSLNNQILTPNTELNKVFKEYKIKKNDLEQGTALYERLKVLQEQCNRDPIVDLNQLFQYQMKDIKQLKAVDVTVDEK